MQTYVFLQVWHTTKMTSQFIASDAQSFDITTTDMCTVDNVKVYDANATTVAQGTSWALTLLF